MSLHGYLHQNYVRKWVLFSWLLQQPLSTCKMSWSLWKHFIFPLQDIATSFCFYCSVQLSGPDFEGFFIQARDAEDLDSPAVGSFVLVDRRHSQLLTCGHTTVQSTILKWDVGHCSICTSSQIFLLLPLSSVNLSGNCCNFYHIGMVHCNFVWLFLWAI